MIDLILPTITTDFRMCNAYAPVPGRSIAAPILGFIGDADEIASASSMTEWGRYTTGGFALHQVSGDHAMHEKPSRAMLDKLRERFARITGETNDNA